MVAVLSSNITAPEQLARSFHTFGPTGPAHQVRKAARVLAGGN